MTVRFFSELDAVRCSGAKETKSYLPAAHALYCGPRDGCVLGGNDDGVVRGVEMFLQELPRFSAVVEQHEFAEHPHRVRRELLEVVLEPFFVDRSSEQAFHREARRNESARTEHTAPCHEQREQATVQPERPVLQECESLGRHGCDLDDAGDALGVLGRHLSRDERADTVADQDDRKSVDFLHPHEMSEC